MGGCRFNKHVGIWAKNAFDEWWWFCGYEINMSIADLLKKGESV